MKKNQLQYNGFYETAVLWTGDLGMGLEQIEISAKTTSHFPEVLPNYLRLGKCVERFVSHQLKQEESILILAENIQIHQHKITLGELDCILMKGRQAIHLEVIYKFYLYDDTAGNSELAHWIGPNRKDSLLQKLTKLREKQLPLLYHEETKKYIDSIDLNVTDIKQQVNFKAQLFVPLTNLNPPFNLLNPACISGFYIFKKQLDQFCNFKFFIPSKIDWLQLPNSNVNWLSFEEFTKKITPFFEQKIAPLCWLKSSKGDLQKFFMVWWKENVVGVGE